MDEVGKVGYLSILRGCTDVKTRSPFPACELQESLVIDSVEGCWKVKNNDSFADLAAWRFLKTPVWPVAGVCHFEAILVWILEVVLYKRQRQLIVYTMIKNFITKWKK